MKKTISILLVSLIVILPFTYSFAISDFEDHIKNLQSTITDGLSRLRQDLSIGWSYLFSADMAEYYIFSITNNKSTNNYIVAFSPTKTGLSVDSIHIFSHLNDDELITSVENAYQEVLSTSLLFLMLMHQTSDMDSITQYLSEYFKCFESYLLWDFTPKYSHYYNDIGLSIGCDEEATVYLAVYLPEEETNYSSSNENNISSKESATIEFPNTKKYRDISEPLVNQALIKFGSQEMTEVYLTYFDSIWGELTAVEGKVVYSTITPEQEKLINYPELNIKKVYYAPNGKSYHSTDWCYTLLKSNTIREYSLTQAQKAGFAPCSKCVR